MTDTPLSTEDRFAIQDLMVRYATAIDNRDWALLRSCFTEQCNAEYGEFGAWSTADDLAEAMDGMHKHVGVSLHRMSNISPVADGDDALSKTYVDVTILTKDGDKAIKATGWYEDRLVRQDGGWKIRIRRYTPIHTELPS